jgi:hypothetical protein
MNMRHKLAIPITLFVALAFVSLISVRLLGQANQLRPLITERVDDTQLTVLRGNTYPLARPEYDRGAVSPTMLVQHRQLVLKRSPEQEAALDQLLDEQLDRSSPNYHKWLTPVEFGQRFGPAPQDIAIIVAWLQSHGLKVAAVSPGRTAIEFSGTAAQVEQTFHTEIHNYDVNGEMHWANVSDPQIPTALTPVVAGVAALHDFKPRPLSHVVHTAKENAARGVKPAQPLFTYPSGCTVGGSGSSACNLALGPTDFATIYNVSSVWNEGYTGTGQTIAVMGQATISPSDISAFREIFDVLPLTNLPTIVSLPNDAPPALGADITDESESDLDLEWSGAIAPSATIEFVTSSNVIDSAFCTVNNFPSSSTGVSPSNGCAITTPQTYPQILSLSYGLCELETGSSNNTFVGQLWQQAAGEGITVVAATGDSGSADCDPVDTTQTSNEPAQLGLAVSGLASTPYNVAVGGTDFNDFSDPSTYWNSSNAANTQLSAKGYIPETTYNDSCTNSLLGVAGYSTNPETNCNNTSKLADFIYPTGGGGGMSNCTTSNGSDPSSCAGGWPKPAWQVAPGVPNDGKRDLPDVSLFSGNGLVGSYYIECQADNPSQGGSCNLSNGDFLGVGGTSASAQAFAGIVALVNVANNFTTGQGNINPTLYNLAQQQSASNCNSSSPGSSCVFNDVTVGTNAQPCVKGTPNCNVSSSSDANGILTGCDASTGYDLATGLGSVNVANLVGKWKSGTAGSTAADFWLSLGTSTTPSCNGTVVIPTPGNSGSFIFTVTQVNGFTGSFTDTSDYSCSGLPSLSTCAFSASAVDRTHTSVTVTVATTAASMTIPTSRPKGFGWWTTGGAIALACLICTLLVALGLRRRYRCWTTAFALVLFAALLIGGCGGSSSGGGGCCSTGGTPAGLYPAIVTVTSGSTTHTLNFTLSVR